jgi:hypothetical protein
MGYGMEVYPHQVIDMNPAHHLFATSEDTSGTKPQRFLQLR